MNLIRHQSTLTATMAIASLFWLPGCASVRTHDASIDKPSDGHSYAGLHYFLPKGVIDISGAPGADPTLYEVTIARRNEADCTARYRLIIGKNWLYDDVVKFGVDGDGLLNGIIDASGDSKIKDIVDNLADTAINLGKIYLKIYGDGSPKLTANSDETKDVKQLKPFKVSFDPYDAKEIASARAKMDSAGFSLGIDGDTGSRGGKGSVAVADPGGTPGVDGHLSKLGVYYRPLTTVKISVECLGAAAIAVHKNIPVPDRHAIAVYSISRGAFVKRINKPTFRSGEPYEVDYNYPSEALAFTTIPLSLTTKALAALDSVPALSTFIYRPPAGPKDPNSDIKAQTARYKADEERYIARQELYAQQQRTAEERKKAAEAATVSKGASSLSSPSNPKPPKTTGMTNFDAGAEDGQLGLPKVIDDVKAEVGGVKKKLIGVENTVTDVQSDVQKIKEDVGGVKENVSEIKKKTDKIQ